MAVMPNMDRNRKDRPSAGPQMTRRAGGVQDSGQGARPGALTARGGMGYTAPIPSPRQKRSSNEMVDVVPKLSRFPRQDESLEAQNFARILFGPGALQARGGSGYQGLDTEAMKNAARAMALQSRMQMPEEMGSTVPGEGMNRPAPDINDAVFGPDRQPFQWTDIIDFLTGKTRGGGR